MTLAAPPRTARRPATSSGDLIGLGVIALAYFGFCAYAVATGMPAAHLVSATLTVAILQLLPGVLVWRAIRPRDGRLIEDLAFGFACGFCLSVLAQTIGGLLDSPLVSIVIPLGAAAVLAAAPPTRRRIRTARHSPTPAWFAVIVAVSSVGAIPGLITYVRQNPVTWAVGYRAPHVDQYFQLAMAKELLHRGPVEWPLVAGEGLSYHWFAHAWMAHVAAGSFASPEEVLFRFAPVISPFLIVVCVAALALRISGRPLVASAAVLLTMFGGTGSVWHSIGLAAPLNPASPTLALSVPALLALAAVLAMHWRGEDVRWPYAAVFLFAVVAAGTKGSATPLVVAGTALAFVAMLVWRRDRARAVGLDLLTLVVALVFTLKVVFHGSADALTLDPRAAMNYSWPVAVTGSGGTLVLVLGALTMLLSGLSRAALGFAVLGRDDDRAGRRDPVLWMLIGSAFAGAFAPLLFVQPGASQFYFRLSAIPLAATASAVGLGALWEHRSRGTAWLAVLAVVGGVIAWRLPALLVTVAAHHPGDMMKVLAIGVVIVALVGGVAWSTSRHGRMTAAVAAVCGAILITGVSGAARSAAEHIPAPAHHPPARAAGAIGAGQTAAARYIGAHAGIDDLVMTNRHCTAPGRKTCDSRYFMVGAMSGREMLVEGWGYSPTISARYPHGRDSITAPFWDPALLRLNDRFYTAPTAAAAKALWDKGVRWIYVDKLYPHAASLAPYATLRFNDDQAQAWQLSAPQR